MRRLALTEEQGAAATSRAERLFIEANPGSGKTTVAAERYGVTRFAEGLRTQPVAAVSFTRSATRELSSRIEERWGSRSLAWPHRVTTLDTLVCDILHYLLGIGGIRWPAGHATLEVLDDWQGHKGYRWLSGRKAYKRVVVVEHSGVVSSTSVRVTAPQAGFGTKSDFHSQLERGRCTHAEVRKIVEDLLGVPGMREAVTRFLCSASPDLLVDEVFDANPLDLALVGLACEAGLRVTLIGDPWQALYGFRGARPDLVPQLVERYAFERLPLSRSFRFETAEMQALAADLRAGSPITLSRGGANDEDVVLASTWDLLWEGPDHVLPLSFGRIRNRTDAAAIVLLDHLVGSRLSRRAIFLPEALILLDLDPDTYRIRGPDVLGGIAELLTTCEPKDLKTALAELRTAMRELGAPKKPRASTGKSEQRQLKRLYDLSLRLRAKREVVPGMTIHQAKGTEWDRVGVRLSPNQITRLGGGLSEAEEPDRAMYVALTRARRSVTLT